MKIAIVGTGISGMVAAYLLHRDHDVTVFEADDRIGGHTNTVDVEHDGRRYAVDTGFIVFNDWTYPNFIRLLDRIGVASQPSDMSFSVTCEETGAEYCSSSINALFARRSNALRLSFYRMLLDIARFNREARRFLNEPDPKATMTSFLRTGRFSRQFVEQYAVPMMAAIWSADPFNVQDFPARYFLQFFENHGLLNMNAANRPKWRVVRGGSQRYAEKLTAPYRDRIRLASPVESILRLPSHVMIKARGADPETFDHVVIAAHSDQALRMLADPSDAERDVLGAIAYQPNTAILHTDESLLPKRRLARASWNYHIPGGERREATVTYNMNRLQSIDAPVQFNVSLNEERRIDPAKVIRRIEYQHPIYTRASVEAQRRHDEISAVRRTHYCGAYWGYGFHEDGVKSALQVARWFGAELVPGAPVLERVVEPPAALALTPTPLHASRAA